MNHTMSKHGIDPDWCHLCGKRSNLNVDIWFPENAEHGGKKTRYIRICVQCGHDIVQIGLEQNTVTR